MLKYDILKSMLNICEIMSQTFGEVHQAFLTFKADPNKKTRAMLQKQEENIQRLQTIIALQNVLRVNVVSKKGLENRVDMIVGQKSKDPSPKFPKSRKLPVHIGAEIYKRFGVIPTENITFTNDGALTDESIFHYGTVQIFSRGRRNKITLSKIVDGDIIFVGVITADTIILPQLINGFIDFGKLEQANSISLPRFVKDISLLSLISVGELKFPERVYGTLYLNSITSIDHIKLPEIIDEALILSSVSSIKNANLPRRIGKELNLRSVKSIEDINLDNVSVGGPVILNKSWSQEDKDKIKARYSHFKIYFQ